MTKNLLLSFLTILFFSIGFAQNSGHLPIATLKDRNGNIISTSSFSNFDKPIVVIVCSDLNMSYSNLIYAVKNRLKSSQSFAEIKIIAISTMASYYDKNFFDKSVGLEAYVDMKGELKNKLPANMSMIFFLDDNQDIVFSSDKLKDFEYASRIEKITTLITKKEITASKVYFDSSWVPSVAREAYFYRIPERTKNGTWMVRDYYSKGNLQYEGESFLPTPDYKIGKHKYYHPNGTLSAEANYSYNVLNGEYLEFYSNGKKRSESFYSQGVRNGKGTWYFENGRKRVETNYSNGYQDGKQADYFENGEVKAAGSFKAGKLVGVWTNYNENGKKIKEEEYKAGFKDGVVTGWYDNGKTMMFKATFKDGAMLDYPRPVFFDKDGNSVLNYKTNGSQTTMELYDEKKVLRFVKESYANSTSFVIKIYDELARQQLFLSMKGDEIDGKVITWYENGQKESESSYTKDKPVGKAIVWYENGTIKEKADFDKQVFEYFDRNGQKNIKPNKNDMELDTKEGIIDSYTRSGLDAWIERLENFILNYPKEKELFLKF